MTDERDFDRLARAWLELGPDLAPDRSVAAVLQAVETTPQIRRWARWLRGREPLMTRLLPVATLVVVAVVAVGGLFLVSRPNQGSVGGPSASPTAAVQTASPSAPAADTLLPEALRHRWVGEPRDIGRGVSSRTALNLSQDAYYLSGTNYVGGGLLGSTAAVLTPGQITLVTPTTAEPTCAAGDTGVYTYTLSPGATRLTMTKVSDECAARAIAVAGDWYRVACRTADGGCWGDLEAGTYPTQYIAPRLDPGSPDWAPNFGGITYTVPDGWSNSDDWPDRYVLMPAVTYATVPVDGTDPGAYHGIFVYAQPAASNQIATCDGDERTDVARTPEGLAAWIGAQPSVIATVPKPITIDGHDGVWLDVQVAPDWVTACSDTTVPTAMLLTKASGTTDDDWVWGISGPERTRFIFLDLGAGDTVLIGIDSTYPDRFDQLVTEAMPIVQSFHFN